MQGAGSKCTWLRFWSGKLVRGHRLWRTQRGPDALLREPAVGGCKGRSRLRLQRTWETISFADFKDQELGSLEGNARKATERGWSQTVVAHGVLFGYSGLGAIVSV